MREIIQQQPANDPDATPYPVVEAYQKAEWFKKIIEDRVKKIREGL